MIQQILNNYRTRRDEILQYLSDNFDMFNESAVGALRKMQDHVYQEEQTIKILVHKLNERINFVKEVKDSSAYIDSNYAKVKAYYLQKKIYEDYAEESSADKWLINALILILRDQYTFNGVMFQRGNKSRLASDLLKEPIKEIDVTTLEYKEIEK